MDSIVRFEVDEEYLLDVGYRVAKPYPFLKGIPASRGDGSFFQSTVYLAKRIETAFF